MNIGNPMSRTMSRTPILPLSQAPLRAVTPSPQRNLFGRHLVTLSPRHPLTLSPLPLLSSLCLLALVTCHLSPVSAQTDRQTKLILPKMVPEAKPELVAQVGHAVGPVYVAFHPSGRKLASGAPDLSILIYDLDAGQVERRLKPGYEVRSVAFSPDGTRFASAGSAYWATVWDTTTWQVATTLRGKAYLWMVAFSPDGKKLATASNTYISATGAPLPGEVVIWDVTTGNRLRTLAGHQSAITTVAFSPDGKQVASGSADKTVRLWDAETGDLLRCLEGHSSAVSGLSFSPEGHKLVSSTSCYGESKPLSEVAVWDVRSGQQLHKIPLAAWSSSASFSPDGSKMLIGGRDLKLYHCDNWVPVKEFAGGAYAQNSVAFSSDAKRVAASVGNSVAVWNAVTGERERLFESRARCAMAVACTPNGNTLACGNRGGFVVLWDTMSGRPRAVLRSHRGTVRCLAFSADGTKLASGARDNLVIVWDVASGHPEQTLKGHTGQVRYVAFTSDSKKLVSASWGGTAGIDQGGVPEAIVWDLASGQPERTFRDFPGILLSVGLNSDTGTLTTASWGLNTDRTQFLSPEVRLWDVNTGQPQRTLEGDHWKTATYVLVSRDGSAIAVQSRDGKASWLQVGGHAAEEPKEIAAGVNVRCIVGEAKHLLLVSGANTTIWDTSKRQSARVLPRLPGWGPEQICMSADMTMLASVSYDDANVRLWSATPGKESAAFTSLNDGDDWLTTTPQGYYDCSLEAASWVSWKLGDILYPFDQFEEKYHRPDLVRKALAGEDISNAPPLDGTQIPPNIAFLTPSRGEEVKGDKLTVTVTTAGVRPIQRLELSVNGRPVPEAVRRQLEIAQPTEKIKTFQFQLPLPPEPTVRLRAAAYDTENLRSRAVETFVRRAQFKQQAMNLWVLAVGVSKYRDPRWQLRFASADARAFSETLAEIQKRYYAKVTARVLTDAEATVSNLRFGLRWLKDNATENDIAVVFVAGHGILSEEGAYYFGAHELDERDVKNTCLNWEDFVTAIQEVRAKQVAVWIDTCHAGSATGTDQYMRLIDNLNRKAGVLVFAASLGNEASLESEAWQHGAFTKAFVEGLRGAADQAPKDGAITVEEMRLYIISRVVELTQDRQHPYVPRLKDFGTDWVMARLTADGGARSQGNVPGVTPQPGGTDAPARGQTKPSGPRGVKPERQVFASPPASLAPKLEEGVRFDWKNLAAEEVFRTLLEPRDIRYRFQQKELSSKRVTMSGGPSALKVVLRVVLQNLGAVGTWEGETLVVEGQ